MWLLSILCSLIYYIVIVVVIVILFGGDIDHYIYRPIHRRFPLDFKVDGTYPRPPCCVTLPIRIIV